MSNIIWALACVEAAPEAGVLHALVQHTNQLLLQVGDVRRGNEGAAVEMTESH
jgi:hypothetical protein